MLNLQPSDPGGFDTATTSHKHGWKPLTGITSASLGGITLDVSGFAVAPITEDYRRCGCTALTQPCTRSATQEDLLCDECREGTH